MLKFSLMRVLCSVLRMTDNILKERYVFEMTSCHVHYKVRGSFFNCDVTQCVKSESIWLENYTLRIWLFNNFARSTLL